MSRSFEYLLKMRTDNEIRITPSVLDRLLDYEPEISREPISSRSKSLRQLKQAVKRDLEWLLNTRQFADELPPDLEHLNSSLAAFGLPDFTNINISNPSDQTHMRRVLEAAIGTFEPRLEDVVVTLLPSSDSKRLVHFRVDARLRIEPAPEPITFDTALQLNNGVYVVKEE